MTRNGSYPEFGHDLMRLSNFTLITLFLVKLIYHSNPGYIVMRFIAFSYTYHYLNWFSKTSVIQWHRVSKMSLIATIVIWLGSVAIYLYDYSIGLKALFFLSFLHVFLEFPLNITSFQGIIKSIIPVKK